MKRRLMACTVALVCAVTAVNAEIKTTAIVVAQPSAPVTITRYTATYVEGSTRYANEGIHHAIEVTNASQKEIAAVQYGLVSFDLWNEFLDRTRGLSTDVIVPGRTAKGTWIARAYAGFSFMTGIAYVNRVRFADGEIWTANESDVLAELRKIQKDFDAATLSKKDEPK